MPPRTRVSRHIDTNLLSRAVSRPGIDPRVWSSLGIVEKIVVDENEGVFVDVFLMPTEQTVTARLGCAYSGPGFGMYCPVEVDDEVLVEAPSGDPDNGVVITARLHSASDPPPSDVVDHPTDVLLYVKEGNTVRIKTAGAGNIVLLPEGTGQVLLGMESPISPLNTEGAVNGEAIEMVTGLQQWQLNNASTKVLVKK